MYYQTLKPVQLKLSLWLVSMALALLTGCSAPTDQGIANLLQQPWQNTVQQARGTTVNLMMWQGDPLINAYINEYVKPQLLEQYGITLNVANGQGNQIVSTIMTELEAGKRNSEVDMMWINGETFYQLRQIDGLYGPFAQVLPNSQYIDFGNPFIGTDFQQKTEGYECPWGNVQLALIYNEAQVQAPPYTLEALETWAGNNPGKFTFSYDFTGMTLLKSWLAALNGGKDALNGPFDEEIYAEQSAKLWAYLKRLKPHLWKQGRTYPNDVAQMHQLYASGELYFTMSNNDSEVDNKVAQGLFPATSRSYVYNSGTIQNSHYMGIARQAPNKAGAMVAINFLISPEAQLKKFNPEVWGDGTVLAVSKLPQPWQQRFNNVPQRRYAPKRSDINDKAIMEPAPEYMIRLFEDFRKQIIEGS